MDVATFFFDVDLPSAYADSNVLYPLKECQSNKIIGVCSVFDQNLKCWISKDVSFKLEIDTDQPVYFTYYNQSLKSITNKDSCLTGMNRIECFSYGLLSPYKLDETSVKVKVYSNGDTERKDSNR